MFGRKKKPILSFIYIMFATTQVRTIAQRKGFDLTVLKPVAQEGCTYKSEDEDERPRQSFDSIEAFGRRALRGDNLLQ